MIRCDKYDATCTSNRASGTWREVYCTVSSINGNLKGSYACTAVCQGYFHHPWLKKLSNKSTLVCNALVELLLVVYSRNPLRKGLGFWPGDLPWAITYIYNHIQIYIFNVCMLMAIWYNISTLSTYNFAYNYAQISHQITTALSNKLFFSPSGDKASTAELPLKACELFRTSVSRSVSTRFKRFCSSWSHMDSKPFAAGLWMIHMLLFCISAYMSLTQM